MGALVIPRNDYASFYLCPCASRTEVGLHKSVREKLKLEDGRSHEITKDAALKALKSIERASKFKSFVFNPKVVILTGFLLVGASVALEVAAKLLLPVPLIAIALTIASFVLGAIGGFLAGYGISNTCNNVLPQISGIYRKQAQDARTAIDRLEAADNNAVVRLPEF